MLFTGFTYCLYEIQKFDTDVERQFAVLLEDEPGMLKWFKPAQGHVRIDYAQGRTYLPDFVVETTTEKLLCEPKRTSDLADEEVQQKARAAALWCKRATDHARIHGGKPWQYLLIPHDAIGAR